MKRLLAMLLAGVMVFSLAACGGSGSGENESGAANGEGGALAGKTVGFSQTDSQSSWRTTETDSIKEAVEEAKKAAEAKRKALAASQARSIATAATSAPTGSLNGMALSIPVNGSVSSRFGSRGYSRSSVHTGVDIAASSGTGIRTISAGTVVYSAYKGSYGNLIIIDHGNGVQSYYAHCSALYVSAGQAVGAGTVIGAVGSTGNSTGPHLHLEIRVNGTPVNPQNYLY